MLTVLGWTLAFLAALALSIWVHINHPLVKRAVVDLANAGLADVLYGKIQIDALTDVSLQGISVSHAALLDEQGNLVIELERAQLDFDLIELLAELAMGGENVDLVIRHARVEHSMLRAIADAESREPTLSRALTPRPAKRRGGTSTTSDEAASVRVYFPHIELGVVEAAFTIPGWEQLTPVLGAVKGRVLFSPKGIALDVERFGTTVSGGFGHALRGTGTFSLRAPGALDLDFNGFVDDAEIQARAHLLAGKLELSAHAPRFSPKTLSAWFGNWPLVVPVDLSVTANGELPSLDLTVQGRAEGTEVNLQGPLDLSDGVSGVLRADVQHLDLQALLAKAPATDLNAGADLVFEARGTTYSLNATGSTMATSIDDIAIPAIDFDVTLSPETTTCSVVVREPGATLHAEAEFDAGRLDVDVNVPALNLSRQRRLVRTAASTGLTGVSALDANFELDGDRFKAELDAELAHFGIGPVSARQAHLSARAQGALNAPNEAKLQLQARARELQLGQLSFDSATLSASGDLDAWQAEVTVADADGRRARAKGRVDRTGVMTNVTFEGSRNDVTIEGKARRIDPSEPSIDIPEFEIRGQSGQLTGNVMAKPGVVQGQVEAKELRLERIARSVGWEDAPFRGKTSFSLDVSLGSDVQRARLDGQFEHVSVGQWGDSDFSLWVDLKDGVVEGKFEGSDQLGFTAQAKLNAQLAGSALELESWQKGTGTAELAVLSVPLELAPMLWPNGPLEALQGRAGARVLLQRPAPEGYPNAFIELGADVERANIRSSKDERLTLSKLTTYYSGAFIAERRLLNGSLIATDAQGTLLTATSALGFDPGGWLGDPASEAERFSRAPLNLVVNVPPRRLSTLPGVKLEGIDGELSGQFALYGSVLEPQLSILMNANDVRGIGLRDDRPVSVGLNGNVAFSSSEVELEARATLAGQQLLSGRLQGVVPLGTKLVPRWSADVELQRLPLSLIEPLVAYEVDGQVSGEVHLVQSAEPNLNAALQFSNLSSGRAVLGAGTLTAAGEPGHLEVAFTSGSGPHALEVGLHADAGVADVPMPDEFERAQLRLRARGLDVGALAPLLGGLVARPGGSLDVDMTGVLQRVAADEKSKARAKDSRPAEWRSQLSGSATLADGSAYVEGLGLELRNMSLVAKAEPWGETTRLSISDFEAEARSSNVNLTGNVDLVLDGLSVSKGTGRFDLDAVPITLQGLNLGRATGTANLALVRKPHWPQSGPAQGKDYMDVGVRLSRWQMKAAPSASRDLIDLNRSSDIVVMQQAVPPRATGDVLPFHFNVDLGQHTLFTLADLEVPLGGAVQVDYVTSAKLKGTLLLSRGGRIPIFGRIFEIVDGKVVLNPKQPSNPALDLTLAGRGSDGDMVYVHIGGTLKQPVTEPAPAELQALLGGGAASVLGSGVQALGVSQLLGEAVELRVSSADEQEEEASYTAAVRLNEDLWFEANYQRSSQGSGLSQEDSEAVSGSLDYRFKQRWSVRTKVGNTGGSVDLLWQYRY